MMPFCPGLYKTPCLLAYATQDIDSIKLSVNI